MLHVLIITPIFSVSEDDTITLPFLQLFCKELLKNNVHVTIVAEQYPQKNDYQWHGIQVHTLKHKTPRLLYKFLRKHRLTKRLKKIHSENPITVIHNLWFNILGDISGTFALQHGIKHIITLAGQDILPSNKLLPKITRYTGELICPTIFQKNTLRRHYSVNTRIIGWGIEEIAPGDAERTIDLIHCGWINSVKNNSLFLEIVQALHKRNLIKKVVVCGGGPDFNAFLKSVEQMKLNSVLEIKNSIPREEVLGLMKQSKILVHTSHFESFGLVLAEALACNCIVVSSPVGIAGDVKEIYKCNTLNEFVQQIEKQLVDYKTPQTSFPAKYPISRTVQQYLEVYEMP